MKLHILRIFFIVLIFNLTISVDTSAQLTDILGGDKELTRKEHLDECTAIFFSCSDELWDFVSHVANRESIKKLDKRRRSVAKFFYEERKKLEELGDYKGDKVIYDGLMTYINDISEIVKDDYKELLPHEEESEKSPDKLKNFHKELMGVNKKLSEVTQRYMEIDIRYRVKYFSFKRHLSKKEGKAIKVDDIPEDKVETILDVYETFSPIFVAFAKNKMYEEKLYHAFDKRDTVLCRALIDTFKTVLEDNEYIYKTTPLYNKDSTLHIEFRKVLDHHTDLVENVMPAMLTYYQRQVVFEAEAKAFKKNQATATADDYDEMELKVNEINDSNDKFNVVFNNFIDDRNELYYHFDYVVRHYLSVHIVREK